MKLPEALDMVLAPSHSTNPARPCENLCYVCQPCGTLVKTSQDHHLILLCALCGKCHPRTEKSTISFCRSSELSLFILSSKTTGVPKYFYLSLGRTANRLSNCCENQGLIQLSAQFFLQCCCNIHFTHCIMRHSYLISCWIVYPEM